MLTFKIPLTQIEQQHTKQTAIVLINNARTCIDTVLTSQPTPGGYSTVVSGGNGEADTCLDEFSATSWDDGGLGRVEVVPRCRGGASGGEFGQRVRGVSLDEEAERRGHSGNRGRVGVLREFARSIVGGGESHG